MLDGEKSVVEPKVEQLQSAPSVSSSSATLKSRRNKSSRRFGTRKPASRLRRKEMVRLREVSMKVGGAQYFKKKINEAAHCEVGFSFSTTLDAFRSLNIED